MRDDRDHFDPDFSPSIAMMMRGNRIAAMPFRTRVILALLIVAGTIAMVIAALLVVR